MTPPPDALPAALTILYHGQPIEMRLLDGRYVHLCPGGCCHAYHGIAVTPEAQHHRLIIEADGAPTFVGQPGKSDSIGCNHNGCKWHVFISHGVATDC